MTDNKSSNWQKELGDQLKNQAPFSLLPKLDLEGWIRNSERVRFKPGQRLIRPDELNNGLILVLKGNVRLIAYGNESEGPFSLEKRGPGQLLGWASILRGAPTEFVQASTEVVAMILPAREFVHFIKEVPSFSSYFCNLTNIQEAYAVGVAATELEPKHPHDWRNGLLDRVREAKTISLASNNSLNKLPELPNGWSWHISTPEIPEIPVGTPLKAAEEYLPERPGFQLPYRLIALPEGVVKTTDRSIKKGYIKYW